MIPFRLSQVQFIGNYVNHGKEPKPPFDGYTRTGPFCVTGDRDETKPTYWHGMFRHDGTDFQMPIGTPIYSPVDGYVTGSGNGTTSGINIEIRTDGVPGERLYFRFLHLSKSLVESHDVVKAGELVAFSGDTGICGIPHVHLSIGTSSGSGNIDPLTDRRFQHWLQGIPYIPREGQEPRYFYSFGYAQPDLMVNGNFSTCSWRGETTQLEFRCTEPIVKLLHPSKNVNGEWLINGAFDVIEQLGEQGHLGGYHYTCVFEQKADPGVYIYQADTANGYSKPVRVIVRDRAIM